MDNERRRPGLFLDYNKWWLAPALVVLLIAVVAILFLLKYKYRQFIYMLF